MIQRRQDWRSRLRAWADAVEGQPFIWGETDCAALGRAALEQMFGQDIIDVPRWHNARGAVVALSGVGSIEAVVLALGAERTTLPFLRAGDLVLSTERAEEVGGVAVLVCIDGCECITGHKDGVRLVNVADETDCSVYSLWEVPERG